MNLNDETYFKVISPLSIIGAMYMLAAGSKGASQSEILNKESFLTVCLSLTPTQSYSFESGFSVYSYLG